MPTIRKDISNEEILELLATGKTLREIARIAGCSRDLIRRVKRGKRMVSTYDLEEKDDEIVMCSCCGFREKDKDLDYLCKICFKNPPEGLF